MWSLETIEQINKTAEQRQDSVRQMMMPVKTNNEVSFTLEECKSLYDFLDMLSGGNPENIFAWDGTDSMEDVSTRTAYKLFTALGRRVPENLK